MRAIFVLLTVGLAAVAASPTRNAERIVGGSITNIGTYPMAVALIRSATGSGTFSQACGGSILNNRSVLTAAHCIHGVQTNRWRSRVGSTNANSGGVVHHSHQFIHHPQYVRATADNDVSIIRLSSHISFNNNVRAGSIAGPNLHTPDGASVWAIGWGRTSSGGSSSEQLRHVQIWVVNQTVCRNNYQRIRRTITDNMLCSGWINVGGRDQCQGDSGGPLFHNNVIVGVCSWGEGCALPDFPGVNVRVSRVSNWIRNNA
ncbi:trypsin, alkaline A-like [Bicyclus anynana]|uniref:Trypsin, alkaline A-like n=1 Tax=Bicyclus anynana TaxID=110368 RepID=A0A6J1MMN8_BICAN|nr:trypsin, alkaline A-like [Bicyclus anynana]